MAEPMAVPHRLGLPALTVLAVAVIACVPTPVGRESPGTSGPAGSLAEGSPTPVATPAGPTPLPSFVYPTPTPTPPFAAYTVKRGDTLTSLALRFKTSARSIAYWNRVTYPSLDPDSAAYQPNRLEVGWVLLYLPGQVVDPEDLPTLSPSPTPSPSPTLSPSPTPASS